MALFRGAAAFVFLAVLASQAAAEDKTELKWKFEKGKAFYQELVVDMKQTMTVMGNKTQTDNLQTMYISWTPVKQLDDKSWVIKEKILGMKMVVNANNNKIIYDSTDPTVGPKELVETLKPLIGAEFDVTVSPAMKTTKVEGLQDLLDKLGKANPMVKTMMQSLFSEDTLKQMSDQLFSLVPNKAVAKGDKWVVDSKVPLGAIGSLTTRNQYTYEGKTGALDMIKVETSFLKHEPPGANAPALPFKFKTFDMKGSQSAATVLFNAEKGRIGSSQQDAKIQAKITVEAGGMDLEIDLDQSQKVTIKNTDANPLKK